MAAKFEIGKDHAGKSRFHLKAPEWRDYRCQPGLRDEGKRRERHRGHQDARGQRPRRRPHRSKIQLAPQSQRSTNQFRCRGCRVWGRASRQATRSEL
jgi:hypothetical protein